MNKFKLPYFLPFFFLMVSFCFADRTSVLTDIIYLRDTSILKVETFPPNNPFCFIANPNPFNPAIRISISPTLPLGSSVCIYNISGKLIQDITPYFVTSSSYTWTPSASSSGMYLIVVKTRAKTRYMKLYYVK